MTVNTKIILNPKHTNKDGSKSVVLRVMINRKRRYINLGFKTNPKHWSESKSRFKKSYNEDIFKHENIRLEIIEEKAAETLKDLEKEDIEINHKNFIELFKLKRSNKKSEIGVFDFFDEIIEEFEAKGKIRTAVAYKQSKNAVQRYWKKKHLDFSDIDVSFLNKCEVFLSESCKGNAISAYYRSLRALFNKAISRELCDAAIYPFYNTQNQRGYKISDLETETSKRAISVEEMKKILDFDISEKPELIHSRNMFLFSFYTMGMNFVDMAHLTWKDISKERITYIRHKTKKSFSIKILKPVKKIIDYYRNNKSYLDYVFPILCKEHETVKQKATRTQTALKKFNEEIKKLAEISGVVNYKTITSYVIRHSWATIMRKLGHSVSEISNAMQHTNEKTTQIYINSIENDTVDNMNESILNI